MTDNGEDFEKLRRLRALKRHELPPPGYFERLPDRVTTRIELEAAAAGHTSFWGWVATRFDVRPLIACTCGVAVGGLLLTGFHISQTLQADSRSNQNSSGPLLAGTAEPLTIGTLAAVQTSYRGPVENLTFSSINPVFEPITPSPQPQTAGFGLQRVSWGGSR